MKHKVLIVDDNPKNLQVIAATLSENNYQVEVALSGKAALVWLENTSFDIILLDIMMPEMDGYETCKAILSNPKNKNIPIIFLTARNDIESVTSGFKSGGVDYVTKPFNNAELLARLATHIELKEAKEKLIDVNNWLETEVNRKTIALQKANNALQKLDDSKNDFLKSISHEIRTPLNGIIGSLNLLRGLNEDTYFNEVIELLDVSVTNLERYSYAALQIANLQLRGENQLELQKMDLQSICKGCLTKVEAKGKAPDIPLKFESNCDEAIINADLNYLQNAIIALLESSLTYTETGEVKIKIQERENSFLVLIEDTGSLYPNVDISHFFDSINYQNYQFQRNNAMELHLAKIIIQLHHGTIKLQNNEDGKGTKTIISIPKANVTVSENSVTTYH